MSALQGRAPRGSEAEHGAQAGEPLLHAVSSSQTYTDVSLRFFPLIVAIILHYIISIKEKASDRINQPFSNYIYLFGLKVLRPGKRKRYTNNLKTTLNGGAQFIFISALYFSSEKAEFHNNIKSNYSAIKKHWHG